MTVKACSVSTKIYTIRERLSGVEPQMKIVAGEIYSACHHFENVLLEDESGQYERFTIRNQSIEVPVGDKIVMSSVDGSPLAYLSNKASRVKELGSGYLQRKNTSIAECLLIFVILLVPVYNCMAYLSMAPRNNKFYDKGRLVTAGYVSYMGLLFMAIGFFLTVVSAYWMIVAGLGEAAWLSYVVSAVFCAFALIVFLVKWNNKVDSGAAQLRDDVFHQVEALRSLL